MNKSIACVSALIFVALYGCAGNDGSDGDSGQNGQDGSSCRVEDQEAGALVVCDDGSTAFVSDGSAGADGQDGVNGQDGEDGTSCTVVLQDDGARIFCEDGTAVTVSHGADGEDGTNGTDGEDGLSCSVFTDAAQNLVIIFCEDGTVAYAEGFDGCPDEAQPDPDFPGYCQCDPGYEVEFFPDGLWTCVGDFCMDNGWYNDGFCDTVCPSPDADCS